MKKIKISVVSKKYIVEIDEETIQKILDLDHKSFDQGGWGLRDKLYQVEDVCDVDLNTVFTDLLGIYIESSDQDTEQFSQNIRKTILDYLTE